MSTMMKETAFTCLTHDPFPSLSLSPEHAAPCALRSTHSGKQGARCRQAPAGNAGRHWLQLLLRGCRVSVAFALMFACFSPGPRSSHTSVHRVVWRPDGGACERCATENGRRLGSVSRSLSAGLTRCDPTPPSLSAALQPPAASPDTSHIMLHIGFGFHLEMGLEEAQAFIGKRTALLERCDTRRGGSSDWATAETQWEGRVGSGAIRAGGRGERRAVWRDREGKAATRGAKPSQVVPPRWSQSHHPPTHPLSHSHARAAAGRSC